MLTLYHSRAGRGERPANLAEGSLPKNVAWIDLLKPDPDEKSVESGENQWQSARHRSRDFTEMLASRREPHEAQEICGCGRGVVRAAQLGCYIFTPHSIPWRC